MPRLSINEMTTYHWSFLEDVTGYQAAEIQSIGVWRRKLCDFGEERGIELLRESGLAVSSLSSAGGFTGSDGQTFREGVDDALEALRLAAEIRAKTLVVVAGARAGHTLNHARRLLRDALWELGDAAGHLGIDVALQPMHRRPVERWSFLTTLDAALDMLAWCDHPRVGLVFDFFHMGGESDVAQRLPEIVPFIKIAALCDARPPAQSDNDRCLPGEGQLPLADLIAGLESNGFTGAYDVQLLSEHCWESDYSELLTACRTALSGIAPQTFRHGDEGPADEEHPGNEASAHPVVSAPSVQPG